MDCPKCTGLLERKTFGDHIALHRCNSCFGLWCKPEALSRLKSEWMSEAVVDVGSPQVGQKLNRLDNISCPEGHGPMVRQADDEQRHVWFEECPVCKGVFLDAGEFTDLKFRTLLDWVKGWVAGSKR